MSLESSDHRGYPQNTPVPILLCEVKGDPYNSHPTDVSLMSDEALRRVASVSTASLLQSDGLNRHDVFGISAFLGVEE